MKTTNGRRAFLQRGLSVGLAAAVAPVTRVEVMEAGERAGNVPDLPAFELEEITIAELQEGGRAAGGQDYRMAELIAAYALLDSFSPSIRFTRARNRATSSRMILATLVLGISGT